MPELESAARREGWGLDFMINKGCSYLSDLDDSDRCRGARGRFDSLELSRYSHVIFSVDLTGYTLEASASQTARAVDDYRSLLQHTVMEGAAAVVVAPRMVLDGDPVRAALADDLEALRVIGDLSVSAAWTGLLQTLPDAVEVIPTSSMLLAENGCGSLDCFNGHAAKNEPLMRDTTHLSKPGVDIVIRSVIRAITSGSSRARREAAR